jgi:hypothetical protein
MTKSTINIEQLPDLIIEHEVCEKVDGCFRRIQYAYREQDSIIWDSWRGERSIQLGSLLDRITVYRAA